MRILKTIAICLLLIFLDGFVIALSNVQEIDFLRVKLKDIRNWLRQRKTYMISCNFDICGAVGPGGFVNAFTFFLL